MGGGKGGSDFDPKGKSDNEVMKFCQSFMTELYRHIGADTDVPAGDIGVGGREIGYMFGQYKKITNKFESVLTGKGIEYGGSLVRPEATGYGLLYFVREMLKLKKEVIKGKVVAISGSGNVSQYAAQKTIQMGGKVVTLSDSNGTIYDAEGVDEKKLAYVMELKNIKRGRIEEYAEKFGCEYYPNEKPWKFKCDIALPSATQNEISKDDAKKLINNGVIAVGEGANMPSTIEAIDLFLANDVLFGPAKAANAGGVATSGLEMCQNHIGLSWTFEEVDAKLDGIMTSIFKQSTTTAEKYAKDRTNLVVGSNIAGFMKVGNAMLAQGVV
ncbi:glutamate dehydrogenase, NADP-specific (fragment) [groundwater metagenome]|uniref:Glutamate dehydrogenase, NADP-specific n=1 Tax=groundwater metagenome TaxID=717931 RepID=A0A098EBL0_9ZZZZ